MRSVIFTRKFEAICIAFSPDGKHAAIGTADKLVKLLDLQTGKEVRVFRGHTNRVFSVAFEPNGKHLVNAEQPTPDSTVSEL